MTPQDIADWLARWVWLGGYWAAMVIARLFGAAARPAPPSGRSPG